MRNLIFAINVTLDGCCDHTRFNPDEETLEYFTRLSLEADTFLYGRKTYQLMVPYWPEVAKNPAGQTEADLAFARAFGAVSRIIVFSRSLGAPGDGKTQVVRNDLQDAVRQLKQEQGKNILTGGEDVPSQLVALGLIDEYHFVIHPIVAGAGRRLFDGINLAQRPELKLMESRVFRSGCIALRYRNHEKQRRRFHHDMIT